MKNTFDRRQFLAGSAGIAAGLTLGVSVPPAARAGEKIVKVGAITPLTGDAAGWGVPAYDGYRTWIELTNEAGGIKVGDDTYMVEVEVWDDEFLASKALTGAKKMVGEDNVQLVTLLCSTPVIAVQPYLSEKKVLSATTCTTDLSPASPYLLSVGEVHPFYIPPSVDWLVKSKPGLKTAALLSQDDELGVPSLATYRFAFEQNGVEVVHDERFPLETLDFAPIISAALAKKPDILCFDTTYPDFMNLMIEQAFQQGFRGQMMSVTLDNYAHLIDKTSVEFLEGFIFLFPDFDDPRLSEADINFPNPLAFYERYNKNYPGTWTSQSWTYAAVLEVWKRGVEAAGSVDPMDVYAALQKMDPAPQIFGNAKWWGKDVFGVNNALMGRWPIVQLQKGKAKIVEMGDVSGWMSNNQDALVAKLRDVGMIHG
ncbi:MAG: ABC transporter substrate-binding protein [Aestuariivirga sp.]|nr:ABC transporter substrate-binding protein [Aestuariivirga sp.]